MPRLEDAREEFVVKCIETLCSVEDAASVAGEKSVGAFLNDSSCRLLQVTIFRGKNKDVEFLVTNDRAEGKLKEKVDAGERPVGQVHFVKNSLSELTHENIRENVVVTSTQHSPLSSLYHSIHDVYAPQLLNNPTWASQIDQDTQSLLCKLDSQLESALRSGNQLDDTSSSTAVSTTSKGIFTPMDEVNFWEDQAASQSRGSKKRKAEAYRKAFSRLREPFSQLVTPNENSNVVDIVDTVEEIQVGLDDLWKLEFSDSSDAYPQPRMSHLFRVIGASIVKRCVDSIARFDIWHDSFGRVRPAIEEALRAVEAWTRCTEELTGTLWANLGDHSWVLNEQKKSGRDESELKEDNELEDDEDLEPKGFSDPSLQLFSRRLDDILRLRMTSEELRRLLTIEEQEGLKISESFSAFDGVEPLLANKYTQGAWEAAMLQYEKKVVPVERSIGGKISQKLKALSKENSTNPQILLGELVRYRNLVTRPEVQRILLNERETVLSKMIGYIEELDSEFESRSHDVSAAVARSHQHQTSIEEEGKASSSSSSSDKKSSRTFGGIPHVRNLSPTLNAVVWGRQLCRTVENALAACSSVFGDLSAFSKLNDTSHSLLARIESWVSDIFRDWCVDMEDQLDDGELSLHLTGQLMEIDFNGILQVNFSERLVMLLREVRQFSELGLSVPSKVKKAAKEAEKYYRYGVMLKKIANFFNSMETQIIGSQKAMLFDALVAFEKEVTNPHISNGSKKEGKIVTWGDPSDCHAYVERLRQAADKLSSENRRLHKIHEKLGAQVVKLMDIDLLRHADRWKQQWSKLASTMSQLEGSYDPKRMAKWKAHWDDQLYKCLESSYRMGLESLNENLGEIKAELVFSNHQLQFKPPLEELRSTYYRKMKKFIAMPSTFQGFSGGSVAKEKFGRMADRNSASLLQVYRKAEDLFQRLEALCISMEPYVVLDQVVDLDAFVEQYCVEGADWEVNFQAIKLKRRELDKVQDFYRIDCIAVSTTAFKMAVEDQLSRLGDALMVTLRKSVLNVLKQVEGYLDTSMERLSKRPESIQEISDATGEWNTISAAKPDWKKKWNRSEDRRKLLLSVASSAQYGSAIDISEVIETHGRLPAKWENFEVALIAFNDMIEDQREALKARVDDDVENCQQQVEQFVSRWNSLKPAKEGVESWHDNVVEGIFAELEDWKGQFEEIKTITQTCISNCEHFELPVPRFELLEDVERDYQSVQNEWAQYKVFLEQLSGLRQKDWISFRTTLFDAEDFARNWLEGMKGKAKGLVLDRIAATCEAIRRAMPALKFMRGEPFKEEHWSTLFRKLSMPKGVSLQNLTFGHFVDVIDAVAANLQFAKDMTSRAQGEVTIREAITELKSWAETAAVEMMEHEEMGRQTPLIKNWKDILTELGDNQSLLASLKESQYFKPFEQQAELYEKNMAALDDYLGMMNQIQRKWLYLEPIFGRGALPSESNRFKRIDEDWVEIMGKLAAEPLLFNLCDEGIFPRMESMLRTMVDQLERCQKALADFLEEKRSKLPRFYFIGDDDLLEILGQAKNPSVIQSHLKKLFQGIHSVVFDEDKTAIVAVCSSQGEQVNLDASVTLTDNVDEWLQNLSDEVRRTLKLQLVRCIHEKKQVELDAFPSQVLCLAENIKFTARCEHAIKQGKIVALRELLTKTLQEYTSADFTSKPLDQLKVKALILDLVHNIDVCEQLERENVQSLEDWHWDKQLRYYLNTNNDCVVRMCDAEMKYTYEYWGNSPKLVHTPLTDKCYLTLTQGIHMGFGGSPYGPAGTGKTESVKALGSCLGRQVLVFNCDEGIDFQSMGRIFTGLVKCGAWGCFDEFNRLKEDQLSAVSQQIQVIQAAIKERKPTLKLLGKTIDVDCNAGIFVTMNPAGKGYGGRSKLPDNLKQLFRPVAMSRPDNNLIAEVILYSEGFQNARDLGQKLVSLYQLSKELLSPQLHYDWGLRAMKAVLNTGGKLLLEHKKAADTPTLSSDEEREILIKAIRVNTLSKLTFADSKAFLGLISDIFPGAESRDVAYEDLENAIRDVLATPAFRLEHSETQVRKMMQLKESLDQRMGCVIVGPSGCGKTTLWSVLKEALKKTGTVVKTYVMNPKSMPRERLLGHMDMDTREWFDGVLTHAARQVVKEPKEVRSWIVCDGDVDPEWIESLNSVLDDNKLLTMPNGERISFGANVNFIFETHDLRFASPATISRMGMIFLSDEDVDVRRLVSCWLEAKRTLVPGKKDNASQESKEPDSKPRRKSSSKSVPGGAEDEKAVDIEALAQWIEDYFYAGLDWVLRRNAFVVDTTMVGTVHSGLSHIEHATSSGDFLLGLVRGLGGNLDLETRSDFAKYLFELMGETPPSLKAPLDCFSDRGVLSTYSAKTELEGEFTRLAQSGAIIQTVSVQRNLDLLQGWVEKMEPFILVGPEGSGKTMLLSHCFRRAGRSTGVTTLHCNAQTTAQHVIQKIQQSCSLFSTNTGRVFRPRETERLVLYLKDINLPKPDKYDSCMLIAFLQQLITQKGFYDENLEFLGIDRIHIVASMNPSTTVGRHVLSSRFTATVRIAYIDYPNPEELVGVYSSILENVFLGGGNGEDFGRIHVSDPRWTNPSNLRKLADSMIEVFKQVRGKFSVDDHRHYLFTPRDLTQWVLGLMRYDLSEEDLLNVFSYEARRIFRDKLVGTESKARFDSILSNVMRKDWNHRVDDLNGFFFSSLSAASNAVFGATRTDAGESKDDGAEEKGGEEKSRKKDEKLLHRVGIEDFTAIIEHGLMLYEREEKDLNIKLFDQVLEHVAYVDRVLSKPGGSMLLAGRSGVGRRTTTMLVAHMHGMKYCTPNMLCSDKQSSLKAFYNELKVAIQSAGIEGTHTVLYVEDHQIFTEEVLESINSLLCSGEVPGLYKHEELIPLLDPLKELMNDEVCDSAVRTSYDFFVRRIQTFLHVVVSMDPTNDKFLLRCESNPALYTSCSTLWFGEWSKASIEEFPELLFPEYFGKEAPESWDPEALRIAAVQIHEACKARNATPRDFVTFLEGFRHLHQSKAGAIEKKVSQFLGGLAKLEEASQTVDELNEDAGRQRIELQKKQAAADQSMEEITEALQLASKTKKETETLSEELKAAEQETMARKAKIEDELAEIQPILESAKVAVGKIKSDNLNELRSLNMPPDPVADVLSAVLLLLGIRDTSWMSMKRFLGNRGVKEDILNFDNHRITPEIRNQVMKLLKTKASSFEKATIQRVSAAAAPFAAWVKANIRYSLVLEKIQPLEAELDEATRALEAAQQRMQECEEELKEIDERVKTLQENFKKTTKEAAQLNIRLQDTEATLEKAEKLLKELSGEQERWSRQAEDLKRITGTLPMRILLSAAFVNYLGKTPEDVREQEIRRWATEFCNLGSSGASEGKEADGDQQDESFDVKRILSSESEMLVWKAQEGLPGDALSMENAIIILNVPESRCPFVIDPASAATRWLKSHFAKTESKSFDVVPQQDPRFVNQLELAVRFGKTLAIVEVDGVEPILYPLIRGDLKRQGPRWVVQVGDKLIDYSENFKLILVTRNPEPNLPPDASSLVCEVNFTVTRSGLEGQLLGVTVQHEKPELEQHKSEVLREEEEFKVQLSELERELLDTLATSEGNLLENQALLDTLSKTKEKSAEVSRSLENSAKVSAKLDSERDQYRSFARAGSQLYFAITGLTKVNHMYQFSLQSFIKLFRSTLEGEGQNEDISSKMEHLITSLEKRVLYFCGQALFKRDRLMFAMHLTRNIRPHLFQQGEWEFLVGDSVGLEVGASSGGEGKEASGDEETKLSSSGRGSGALPSWAAPDRASVMDSFQETFPRLVSKMELNGQKASDWARWGKHPECEKVFPASVGLSPFQRVLVTFVLRPDRLQSAMTLFCCDALDVEGLSPPPVSITALMESKDQRPDKDSPILLIATPGADPTSELREYAAKTIGVDKYFELAMGGGQTDDAIQMVRDAARNGDWLCLKNLHLVSAWIPRLEKEFNSLDSKHENFRLWLTTEETGQFASILLQQSLKLTFEAPPGIKKNLQRTYDSWSSEVIEAGGEVQARLMFLLAWLHALMQERRTFIPQGWTKFYEFSFGDLRSGLGVLQLAMETLTRSEGEGKEGGEDGGVDWSYIHGLMENSVYGGRIDNPFDLRVLRAYLEKYFNDQMLQGSRGTLLGEDLEVPSNSVEKEAFLDWINQLEDVDAPTMFGLPPNIERSVQRARSIATVDALKSLSAVVVSTSSFDREEWRRKLLPVIKAWDRIAESGGSDGLLAKPLLDSKKTKDQEDGDMDPVHMFVLMEEKRAATMVQKVDRAIRSLSGVVNGTGLLSPQILANASALMSQEVPSEWSNMWEGPSSPVEWLRGLAMRRSALKKWVQRSEKGSLFDHSFDLSELFNPGTFLNALRQQTARKMNCSMDSLRLTSAWSEEGLGRVAIGISLSGLMMQGALLEGERLREPEADAPELVSAPTCYLAFTTEEEASKARSSQRTVSLPVYKNLDRESLLLEVDVPMSSGDKASRWILAGVGFFLR